MKKPGKRVYMAASVIVATGIIGGTVSYQVLNTKAELNPTESQNTDVETENTTQGFSEEAKSESHI